MREACTIAAAVLHRMLASIKVGMTTYDLDQIGKRLMAEYGAESTSYNYRAGKNVFPCYSCISLNEELVHGIASMQRSIQTGDIVSIDVALRYKGFVGDNAATVCVGEVSNDVKKLVDVTQKALEVAIDQVRPGNRIGDISNAVQRYVESNGMNVVRDFVGHGVGRDMHEEPQIPNYGPSGKGPEMKPGMTLALEPMVMLGHYAVEILQDGWTVVTKDRMPCAHFEHTVLVTEKDPEVLTLYKI